MASPLLLVLAAVSFSVLQESRRGEAGDVFEELLVGGTVQVLCAFDFEASTSMFHVVFRPASGPFYKRDCRPGAVLVTHTTGKPVSRHII